MNPAWLILVTSLAASPDGLDLAAVGHTLLRETAEAQVWRLTLVTDRTLPPNRLVLRSMAPPGTELVGADGRATLLCSAAGCDGLEVREWRLDPQHGTFRVEVDVAVAYRGDPGRLRPALIATPALQRLVVIDPEHWRFVPIPSAGLVQHLGAWRSNEVSRRAARELDDRLGVSHQQALGEVIYLGPASGPELGWRRSREGERRQVFAVVSVGFLALVGLLLLVHRALGRRARVGRLLGDIDADLVRLGDGRGGDQRAL